MLRVVRNYSKVSSGSGDMMRKRTDIILGGIFSIPSVEEKPLLYGFFYIDNKEF